jgi:hypothetical protein
MPTSLWNKIELLGRELEISKLPIPPRVGRSMSFFNISLSFESFDRPSRVQPKFGAILFSVAEELGTIELLLSYLSRIKPRGFFFDFSLSLSYLIYPVDVQRRIWCCSDLNCWVKLNIKVFKTTVW